MEGSDSEENAEFWKEAEHEYEPPEHNPKYHEPMPKQAVRTVYEEPVDTYGHPSEPRHSTRTEPREKPSNYFYEYPLYRPDESREGDAERSDARFVEGLTEEPEYDEAEAEAEAEAVETD